MGGTRVSCPGCRFASPSDAPLATRDVEASTPPRPQTTTFLARKPYRTYNRTMSSSPSELPTSRLPDLPDERYPNLPSASTAASSSGSSSSLSSPPLARDVPTTYLGSISAWWAHKDEEIQVAEERLLRSVPPLQALAGSSRLTSTRLLPCARPIPSPPRRMPSFIPDAATPDPLPTLVNPDPLIARLQNFPLAPSPSTSSRLSFFSSPKPRERYLHGLAMYTPKTANRSRHVNVLLHGYGAALGFFAFGNLQAFGEESARTGRRACESCPSPHDHSFLKASPRTRH